MSYRESVLHSFLWPYNILSNGCTPYCLSPHLSMDILIISTCCLLWREPLWTLCTSFFFVWIPVFNYSGNIRRKGIGGSRADSAFKLLRAISLHLAPWESSLLDPSQVLMYAQLFMTFVPMSPASPSTLVASRRKVDMGRNSKSYSGARRDVLWSWNGRRMPAVRLEKLVDTRTYQDTSLSFSGTGTSHCWLQGAREEELPGNSFWAVRKVPNPALRFESTQGPQKRSL